MDLKVRTYGDVSVCDLVGEIDAVRSFNLTKSVNKVLRDDRNYLAFNFEEVSYISSSGLGAMVALLKRVSGQGHKGEIVLSNVSPWVRELFEVTKLETMFKIYDREEEALSYFSSLGLNTGEYGRGSGEASRGSVGEVVLKTEKDELPGFLQEVEDKNDERRGFMGLDSGFKGLNRAVGRFEAGLIMLMGSPKTGKTTFAVQLMIQVARLNKIPCFFYSFELKKDDVRSMIFANLTDVGGLKFEDIKKGRVEGKKDLLLTASREYAKFADLLYIVEAKRGMDADYIRSTSQRTLGEGSERRCLIVIDYLQRMQEVSDYSQIGKQTTILIASLKRLSRDLSSPVVVISPERGLAPEDDTGEVKYNMDISLTLTTNREKTAQLTDSSRVVSMHVLNYADRKRTALGYRFYPSHSKFEEL